MYVLSLLIIIRAKRNNISDPKKVIWINPREIVYRTVPRFNKWDTGKIKGGNWDEKKIPFDNSIIYQGFRDRMILKKRWQDTDYYKKNISEIRSGNSTKFFENEKEFDARCKFYDYLYKTIKEDGYKPSIDIPQRARGAPRALAHPALRTSKKFKILDEITVNIDRNGKYLFNDGKHRIAIAKILALPAIPVQVVVRHKKFHSKACTRS